MVISKIKKMFPCRLIFSFLESFLLFSWIRSYILYSTNNFNGNFSKFFRFVIALWIRLNHFGLTLSYMVLKHIASFKCLFLTWGLFTCRCFEWRIAHVLQLLLTSVSSSLMKPLIFDAVNCTKVARLWCDMHVAVVIFALRKVQKS